MERSTHPNGETGHSFKMQTPRHRNQNKFRLRCWEVERLREQIWDGFL